MDEFERDGLGPNWAVALGSVGIANRSDLALTSSSPIGIVSWIGSNVPADQYSEATLSPDKPGNMLLQAYTRRRSSDGARYGLHYDDDLGDGSSGPSAWQIKFDGVPSAQTRILASSTAPGPSVGDVIRLEARGSGPVELRGYRNGALILTATDTSASAIRSGPPGMAFRLRVGTTTRYPAPVVERWRGGPVAGPSVTTTTQGSVTSAPAGSVPVTSAPGSSAPVPRDPAPSSTAAPGTAAADTTTTQESGDASTSTGPGGGEGPQVGPRTGAGRGDEEAQAEGPAVSERGSPFVPVVAATLAVVATGAVISIARRRVRSRA